MAKHTFQNRESIFKVLKPGEYILKVNNAEANVSSTGNEIIKLALTADGGGVVFDTLVFAEIEGCMAKIDQFLLACGLNPAKGDEIDISPEYVMGAIGRARIKTETYEGKESNKIAYWLTDKESMKLVEEFRKANPF
jgi:hypothetical protein